MKDTDAFRRAARVVFTADKGKPPVGRQLGAFLRVGEQPHPFPHRHKLGKAYGGRRESYSSFRQFLKRKIGVSQKRFRELLGYRRALAGGRRPSLSHEFIEREILRAVRSKTAGF